jgi:hypothetical protein
MLMYNVDVPCVIVASVAIKAETPAGRSYAAGGGESTASPHPGVRGLLA